MQVRVEADHEHEKTACGTYSFGDSSDLPVGLSGSRTRELRTGSRKA